MADRRKTPIGSIGTTGTTTVRPYGGAGVSTARNRASADTGATHKAITYGDGYGARKVKTATPRKRG